MAQDKAETGDLQKWLSEIGAGLDTFLAFKHPDAMADYQQWRDYLNMPLPEKGVGIAQLYSQNINRRSTKFKMFFEFMVSSLGGLRTSVTGVYIHFLLKQHQKNKPQTKTFLVIEI